MQVDRRLKDHCTTQMESDNSSNDHFIIRVAQPTDGDSQSYIDAIKVLSSHYNQRIRELEHQSLTNRAEMFKSWCHSIAQIRNTNTQLRNNCARHRARERYLGGIACKLLAAYVVFVVCLTILIIFADVWVNVINQLRTLVIISMWMASVGLVCELSSEPREAYDLLLGMNWADLKLSSNVIHI